MKLYPICMSMTIAQFNNCTIVHTFVSFFNAIFFSNYMKVLPLYLYLFLYIRSDLLNDFRVFWPK